MFVRLNRQLLEIYICVKQNQPLAIQAMADRLSELRDQILAERCAASLAAYERYFRLITLKVPEIDCTLSVFPEHWAQVVSSKAGVSQQGWLTGSAKGIFSLFGKFEEPTYLDADWLQQQLTLDPSRYDVVLLLARCRLRQGRFMEGRTLLQRVAASRYYEAESARYLLGRMVEEGVA